MAAENDILADYAHRVGWDVRPKFVLVEGTSDVEFLNLAARHYKSTTETDLIGSDFTIVASGTADRGGTSGAIRELTTLRSIGRTVLTPAGKPKYRIIALLDNDDAARRAINGAKALDSSMLEFKDIFRLHPEMPISGNLDPKTLATTFTKLNVAYKGLDWELEDLFSEDLIATYISDNPTGVRSQNTLNGRTHREWTRDGKAGLHRFAQEFAGLSELQSLVDVLKSLRFCMGLPQL